MDKGPGKSPDIKRTTPVVSLVPASGNGSPPPLSDKLDSLITSIRQLEIALEQEQKRCARVQRELDEAHATYDRILKETASKNNELTNKDGKLRAMIADQQQAQRLLEEKFQIQGAELQKLKTELGQYRSAWAGVLQREKEAKAILLEGEKNSKHLATLEKQLKNYEEAVKVERHRSEELERQATHYQNELQTALIRVHSTESKYNELNRDYQILTETKKKMDEEVNSLEFSIRERLRWEVIKERERIRMEFERDAILERQQYQQHAQETARLESEKRLAGERERASKIKEQLELEIHRLKKSLTEAKTQLELQACQTAKSAGPPPEPTQTITPTTAPTPPGPVTPPPFPSVPSPEQIQWLDAEPASDPIVAFEAEPDLSIPS